MFDNIFSKDWEGANSTMATVDGADVRYIVTFVSTGEACAMTCAVIHPGSMKPVAFSGMGFGDRIVNF